MLSWIFRHRGRLQVIYGTVAPPRLAGRRFAEPEGEGAAISESRTRARPGELRRRGRHVVVRPLPRRVAG